METMWNTGCYIWRINH